MQQIYPDLYIGNSTDAYMALYVHDKPDESIIEAVLDVSRTFPSRKWHRAKHIALKKVAIVDGKTMAADKLLRATEFIHEQRKNQKAVLVVPEPGKNTAAVICIAYFMTQKELSWEEALNKLESVCGKLDVSEQEQNSVLKFATKTKNGG